MSSGATAQVLFFFVSLHITSIDFRVPIKDPLWKSKEQSEEARYAHQKEHDQLATLRDQLAQKEFQRSQSNNDDSSRMDKDFEGGFGGQEDLEDRYATTSGEH
ncbi:hypothetical protein BDQ17DRAFT_1306751 [Cyathus striatus]|nr:hypothetical protein BDQ17DRAFT_1306751 [Cyathus striatus]